MGAWGIGTFDNDDALDWLNDLEEVSDLTLIESTLELANEDYIEAPDGCNIIAAAEIILALQGKPRNKLPDNAAEWTSDHSELQVSNLIPSVVSALERVLSDDSEIKELWEESEDYDAWTADIEDLRLRLTDS